MPQAGNYAEDSCFDEEQYYQNRKTNYKLEVFHKTKGNHTIITQGLVKKWILQGMKLDGYNMDADFTIEVIEKGKV